MQEHTATIEQALFEIKKVIVGQEQLLERMLVAILSRGHVLLEGVPGLAKTLAVKTVARVLGGSFSRIQFTPDLVPADLVGARVWHPDTGRFSVEEGPVFANFVLADEINRAPAKVQSALLEVMEEKQVTIAGETHQVAQPYFVLATQNPIESEGVYPLPEAQSDRFLLKVVVGYPTRTEETEVIRRVSVDLPAVSEVVGPARLIELQHGADSVYVDPAVIHYAVELVTATRPGPVSPLGELTDAVEFGASPRASLSLVRAGRALAFLRGRDYVLPQDIGELAYDTMRHRLVLSYQAIIDGVLPEHVIQRALQVVPMPAIDLSGGMPRPRPDQSQYAPADRGADPTAQQAQIFAPPASAEANTHTGWGDPQPGEATTPTEDPGSDAHAAS
ncbi:MAG: MoxR family ATPase [Acidimicrobiia bacterium]|nr:MoxR family ATPase [Acidimicrobiia bacterium]